MTPGPDLIRKGANTLQVPIDQGVAEALWTLIEHLLRWNRKINLVGPCDPLQAIDRHIHDGLGMLRLLDDPEVRDVTTDWTDVGAGAGLPSLVLAIARPDWRFRLVEPIGKKVAFIREAASTLGLTGVEVIQGRMESLEPGSTRGALSRATFAPTDWIQRARDLVEPGGLIAVSMGGDPVQGVVEEAWRMDPFSLPISGAGRTTALVRR